MIDAELLDEEDERPESSHDQLDGAVQSIAEAYPAQESEEEAPQNEEEETNIAEQPQVANDVPEEAPVPEAPVRVVPTKNKKTQVVLDEEDEDEDEIPVRPRNRPSQGATYFPVTFGSTNGGAIAIANSYSTGKGKKKYHKIYDHLLNFFSVFSTRRIRIK